MSKKNIIKRETTPEGKVRLTFETDRGLHTYEYSGSSARAVKRGRDPGDLSGKLIEHKKKETK